MPVFIKSALAIWVSLWLLLPGCVCQILAMFGIDLHPGSTGEGDRIAAQVATLDCHCHEVTQKCAEKTSARVLEEAAFSPMFVALGEGLSMEKSVVCEGRSGRLRAPPPPCWWGGVTREVTGVFLI
ncbi:MAG: hypothetical protein R3F11_09545 [Verrucomicrobiales bacterium]